MVLTTYYNPQCFPKNHLEFPGPLLRDSKSTGEKKQWFLTFFLSYISISDDLDSYQASLGNPALLLLCHFSHVQLSNPTDGSPPGSSVPGILQARILEWVAISFSNASITLSRFSRVRLCATP